VTLNSEEITDLLIKNQFHVPSSADEYFAIYDTENENQNARHRVRQFFARRFLYKESFWLEMIRRFNKHEICARMALINCKKTREIAKKLCT
jgi:hypothetical protein